MTKTRSIRTNLIARERLHTVGEGTEANVTIVRDSGLASLSTFLRGDDNHTIGSTATIDSGSRSGFQNGKRLDISGVHHRERVSHTLDTIVIHSQTIDNNERSVRSVERSTTTDGDITSTTRGTIGSNNRNTRNLTLQHVLRVGHETLVHIIGLDSGNSTGSIAFFHNTITNDNDFFEELIVFSQANSHISRSGNREGLITHVRNLQLRPRVHVEGKIAVPIGNRTVGSTYFKDTCTNNRFAGGSIRNGTSNSHLSHSHQAEAEEQRHQCCTQRDIVFHL